MADYRICSETRSHSHTSQDRDLCPCQWPLRCCCQIRSKAASELRRQSRKQPLILILTNTSPQNRGKRKFPGWRNPTQQSTDHRVTRAGDIPQPGRLMPSEPTVLHFSFPCRLWGEGTKQSKHTLVTKPFHFSTLCTFLPTLRSHGMTVCHFFLHHERVRKCMKKTDMERTFYIPLAHLTLGRPPVNVNIGSPALQVGKLRSREIAPHHVGIESQPRTPTSVLLPCDGC
jgi:hypothetical protein